MLTDIFISYINFRNELPETLISRLLSELPAYVSDKYEQYTTSGEAKRYLLGKLLLKRALSDFGYPKGLEAIRYDQFGRPFHDPPLDFNISHSGDWVVCAVCKNSRVGIDIETIRPLDLSDFRECFNDKDWAKIMGAEKPLASFYESWTLKESILKAVGTGISASLPYISLENLPEISCQGSSWYGIKIGRYDGYACHLASRLKNPRLHFCEVNV